MKKSLLVSIIGLMICSSVMAATFFDLEAKDIDMKMVKMSSFQGKKAIIVTNVASK
jgi:hypothetical protein